MRAICAWILWVFVVSVDCGFASDEIVIRDYLLLPRVGQYGRVPVFRDPVEHARVLGQWKNPAAGDIVRAVDGREVPWRAAQAAEDGLISDESLVGGYAFAVVSVESDAVMLLEAAGHGVVFVNGEPRVGDPYETGYVRIPVALKKGDNEFLFNCSRGRLRAKLTAPPKDIFIDLGDLTLTDDGTTGAPMAGVVVVNATSKPIRPFVSASTEANRRTDHFRIPAHSLRKVPIRDLHLWKDVPKATIVVLGTDATVLDSVELSPETIEPGAPYKIGFVSAIDGSVQYYAVNPAQPSGDRDSRSALVLSLHGAGVEAIGQARAYSAKPGIDIVCPTNRRPFGFDWEDWGRLDALEVLADATGRLQPDPSRVYLTGHSMGGHGTWIFGALFPDRFAALGPSAGWISFASYGAPSGPPSNSPIVKLLNRASSASNTSIVIPNLAHQGIYILHGADDDNVPAEQARMMVTHLSEFHKDFSYHEQPSAGHWWDVSDEPGADCVDWVPLFDLFARRRLPQGGELRELSFVTPSPGVSSRCHWIRIEAQKRISDPSSIDIRVEPNGRRYIATTSNVKRFAIDLAPLTGSDAIELRIDGQLLSDVAWPSTGTLYVSRQDDVWEVIPPPTPATKGPHRYGPFKDAFRNQMIFVYGTQGTDEENAWALAKARYDAETWWYRANGSVDVVPDVEFDARSELDRNVILFGNSDTVACWKALLGESPVDVGRGWVQVGTRRDERDDLACLFIRPRMHSDVASVGVISGSGLIGMRLTDRLPVFLSGVGYPDVTVIDPSVLEQGVNAIRCVGYFGDDWSIATESTSASISEDR